MGRHTESLAENQRAQELDPLRTGLIAIEGSLLYLARRYDEAGGKLRELIKMEPPDSSSARHYNLGLVYEAKGMYEQAIIEYRKGPGDNDETSYRQIILGYALAMSGRRSEAQAILAKLKSPKKYVSPVELAILYVGLGDQEGAIALLERAYAAHDLQMQSLKVDPHYDSLRSDPRFQDMLRRVGLPQ
jgi:tetratricopeptide (TPR) repeat protein